jgi:hypothetical protein
MRKTFVLTLCVLFALSLIAVGAYAKNTQSKLSQNRFVEDPQQPTNAPEIGGSMFQAAAATTVTLGWWQFDTPGGVPTKQGWTDWDITTQLKKYWHVDGNGAAPCHALTPLNGTKSMWCGQWATTTAPWCGWATLPGYGANWDQSLGTAASNVNTISYTISWDSEPGYDFTYIEWWDATNSSWVADPAVNAGVGFYDNAGGPLADASSAASAGVTAPTKVRFHVMSDGAWNDEDGLWDTIAGAAVVDDISINGGVAENWEGEACEATQSSDGVWVATIPPGFGNYSKLVSAAQIVQEDPCAKPLSNLWSWFDNPAVTNYSCGGWPLQGAMPYGPDANGLYMLNEIWSPFVPITGSGTEFILGLLTYRDLPLDNLQFYVWHIRTRGASGCPTTWDDLNFVYYGGQKDWIRSTWQVGAFVPAGALDIAAAIGSYDYCGVWCGIYGTGACHSHAPVIDQVKLQRVATFGPQYTWRDIDMWQDNFPELGGISSTSYARCDMAQDVIPSNKSSLVPGDSLKIVVTDPAGIAADNTGGLAGKAIYVFVKVTDRFGNPVAGKNGLAIQSPDFKRYPVDVNTFLRWPLVPGLAPVGWDAYRLDLARTGGGSSVKDTYCADLMDLAAGPDGPPYHALTENVAANTGIFAPGDVINYFFGAKNTTGGWSYYHRTFKGQGAGNRTNSITEAANSPMEWSVLPDAGRLPGDNGDILLVDDADDRGGPAQLYFDNAFKYMGLTDKVDRFDVLGPSSVVGNSLAGRVKNISAQIIGDPTEIYQKVLWNATDLSRGLMGDGGTPNGGSSAEKSDDYALAYTFLNTHPGNPGWAVWCDDAVQDWNTLVGLSAVNVKSIFMNHTLTAGDQKTVSGVVSPKVFPPSVVPPAGYLQPAESFYAYGGCAVINDFDVPGQSGLSRVSHRYANAATGQTAALSQVTPNGAASQARFFLAGFAYNFIRDDDTNGVPDYVNHLHEILVWFQNIIGAPTGIDPVAFANNLDDNYPNPFNPTTTIKYSIAEHGQVTLKIYNAAGQLVRTLINEEQAPVQGGFSKVWNGMNEQGQPVASGVYFYQLTAKDFSQTKKMVLLK